MVRHALWCLFSLVVATNVAGASTDFVRPADAVIAPRPLAFATADFNRDGRADLALSSELSNEVAVLLGTADGALQNSTVHRFARLVGGLAAGDLNRDSIADLVVADQRGSGVYILYGTGSGTFSTASPIAFGRNAFAVAIADFDQQNGADLVVSDRTGDRIFLLLNDGRQPRPGFTPAGDYPVAAGPRDIRVADLNADGHDDLIVLGSAARVRKVSILLYDQVINNIVDFNALADFGVSDEAVAPVIGDFNGDGPLDVATLNRRLGDTASQIEFLNGRGDGFLVLGTPHVLPCPLASASPFCQGQALESDDFDADGAVDFAVIQVDPRSATQSTLLTILRGSGDGGFAVGPVLRTEPGATMLALGDVTGDGHTDIIVGSERHGTVEVFVNSPPRSQGDRIPGQSCEANDQCVTGLCIDSVCCRTACSESERCDAPGAEGTCVPESLSRPLGADCTAGNQCASGFCVDDVCCVGGGCPFGAHCNIPGRLGICVAPFSDGTACNSHSQCRSANCVHGVCCNNSCPTGRCDVPTLAGTCVVPRQNGQPCAIGLQCTSGICDAGSRRCCEQPCAATEECTINGESCALRPTATPTRPVSPSPSPTETATPRPCRGDCNGDANVAIQELVHGLSLVLEGTEATACDRADIDRDGRVTVDELMSALTDALNGCG